MSKSSPFPPGSHVAAYLRDSGGDKQDLSTDRQEESIRAWCNEQGLILTRLFVDVARSARNVTKRNKFIEMIEYFRHPGQPEKGIVLWSFSRFARNLNDASMYKGMLRGAGYEVVSMTDEIPDGPTGRLVEMIKDWAHELRIVEAAIDIRETQASIFRQHGALGGTPPKGFKHSEPFQIQTHRDGKPHMVSRWVPDPDTWDTVKEAWKLRASGHRYKEINNRLHLFKTVNSYTSMFQNRIYLGEMRFGGIVNLNYAPPMIDEATWDSVQAINKRMKNMANLKDPAMHPRRASSSYMLTGLLYCGLCGAPLNGHEVRNLKTNTTWKYYRCSKANRTGTCQARMMALTTVDYAVLQAITEYIMTPAALAALRDIDQANFSTETVSLRIEKNRLADLLAGMRHRITNITEAIAQSGHSRSLLESLANAELEEAELISQISQIEKKLSQTPAQPTEARVNKLIRDSIMIIDSGDPQAINRLLRGFVVKIIAARIGKTIKMEIDYLHPPDNDLDPPPENGAGRPKANPLR
jgi:DNA invertase Pin-like site-specific DNA recombinase